MKRLTQEAFEAACEDEFSIELEREARRARESEVELRDMLRWVRQTIHQAHHEGQIESCGASSCMAITIALEPPR